MWVNRILVVISMILIKKHCGKKQRKYLKQPNYLKSIQM